MPADRSVDVVAANLCKPDWRQVVSSWAARSGRAVLFDFNGTLSDDEPILRQVYQEIFADALGWLMTPDDYTRLWGHSDREMIEMALKVRDWSDVSIVDDLLVARRERYEAIVADRCPIPAAAEELVITLASARIPIGIVTGARRDEVSHVLAGSRIETQVSLLVTEEDVQRGKPDPEGFLLGARMLGVNPTDVLVFEDSVPGINGALAAGMLCIAVTGRKPHPAVVHAAPATVEGLTPELFRHAGL